MGLITVAEAADRLQISIPRVHQLIQSGRLPAHKFGSQYAIEEADLKLVKDRKPGRPSKPSGK